MASSVTLRPTADEEKAREKGTRRMGDALPMGSTPKARATERGTTGKEEKGKAQVEKAVTSHSVSGNVTSADKKAISQPTARAGEQTRLTKDRHLVLHSGSLKERKLPTSTSSNRRD